MNDITVLITAAGNVYMPGTIACLKNNGERNVRVIGTDMNKDDTILQMCDSYYQVPRGDDPGYIDAIFNICVKEKVDVVIPIMTVELDSFAQNKEKFEKAGIKVSVSNPEALEIANNKLKLLEFMSEHDIPVPKFCRLDSIDEVVEKIGYPIVFKATGGSGSRGMRIIDPSKSRFDILFHEKPNSCYTTLDDFRETLSEGNPPEMIAMEYLPGEEYTVDMLVDEGSVKYSLCRRGLNVQSSIILDGIVEDRPDITSMCDKVAEALRLSGNIGFDVKERSDGTPVIMECNPRADAGIAEFAASGVNLLYLCVKQCIGEELPELKADFGRIMKRRYMEMYC